MTMRFPTSFQPEVRLSDPEELVSPVSKIISVVNSQFPKPFIDQPVHDVTSISVWIN